MITSSTATTSRRSLASISTLRGISVTRSFILHNYSPNQRAQWGQVWASCNPPRVLYMDSKWWSPHNGISKRYLNRVGFTCLICHLLGISWSRPTNSSSKCSGLKKTFKRARRAPKVTVTKTLSPWVRAHHFPWSRSGSYCIYSYQYVRVGMVYSQLGAQLAGVGNISSIYLAVRFLSIFRTFTCCKFFSNQ